MNIKTCLTTSTMAIAWWATALSKTQAASIDYGALGNFIETPSGMLSANGNAVRLGTFASNFDFAANATNYVITNNAFTQLDITSIGAGNSGSGQFFDSTANLSGISGQQLYVWAFNTSDPATSSAWAIVSDNIPSWTGPADGPNSTQIDTSDPGVFVPSGALGSIVPTSGLAGFDIRMVSVPEPSTYAFLGLGLSGLSVGALQRRRRFCPQTASEM